MKSLEVHNNTIKLLNLRRNIFVVTYIKKFLGDWLIFIIFILFMSLFLFAEEIKNISIFNTFQILFLMLIPFSSVLF